MLSHRYVIKNNIFFVTVSSAENMNLFAIVCSVLFISILIIALIVVLSMKYQSAKYYTHEDKLGMISCTLFHIAILI